MKKVLLLIPMLFLLSACFSGHNSEEAVTAPTQQKGASVNPIEQGQTPPDSNKSAITTPAQPAQTTENTSKMDVSSTQYCTSHMINMGEETVWSEDGGKTGEEFWSDGSKHLPDLIKCGWDINAPNSKGVYPLIQAFEVYDRSPDELRAFMSNNPSLDIKDPLGHDLYSIALALKTVPSDILDRLKSRLSKEQQQYDEDLVQLTEHGSTLSTDDLKRFVEKGMNLNEDMTAYTNHYDVDKNGNPTDPDWETGTILGSAVSHKDVSKVKWLLEHGADANQFFGNGEFHKSPLRSALQSKLLSIAELLLQHGANPNEKFILYPGEATLSAYYACDSKISGLLQKYGGTEWYYEDVGDNGMRTYSKEEVLSHCKK